jgi:ABC-2 type transport system permease protein
MKKWLKVALIEMKLFFREKTAVFFTFLFPLFLLFLFGSIWGKQKDYFSYLIPMLISIVAFSNSLFGVGVVLASYRESGILKRMGLTPIPARTYIYGLLTQRFFIILGQSVLLFVLAKIFYTVPVKGNLASLILVILIGILSMISFGGVIAGFSKSHESAIALANVFFTPLSFLSGAFIPIFILPKFLQTIAKGSPIYHFIKAMQDIMIHGKGLKDIWVSLAVIIGFLVICSFISAKTFKLKEG